MRRNKLFWIPPAWIFCLMTTHCAIHAELNQFLDNGNYNPEYIANEFNGPMIPYNNGFKPFGTGFRYITTQAIAEGLGETGPYEDPTLRVLEFDPRGLDRVNVDAYLPGGYGGINGENDKIYITTFRCTRKDPDLRNGIAWLSYNDGKTYDKSTQALTLGTAYLYSKFVQGAPDLKLVPNATTGALEFDATKFRAAIQELYENGSKFVEGYWMENEYLSYLLDITPGVNARTYWTSAYDMLTDYSGIGFGDYYVFVLLAYDFTPDSPNEFASMLYAAPMKPFSDPPPDDDDPVDPPDSGVPEPATLLLWTLGGLGLGGTSWLRRRNKK